MEEPKLPDLPELSPDELKIKELTEYNTNLEFLSNQVRFNSVVYQGIAQIIEQLTKIEEKLSKDGKV